MSALPSESPTLRAELARERRLHRRLSVGLQAHCQIDGIVSQEVLGNLSEGGLFLRTRAQLREGSRVRIVIGLPYIGGQRVCSLSGFVAWVARDDVTGTVSGAGVTIDVADTDDADEALLKGFLDLWRDEVSQT